MSEQNSSVQTDGSPKPRWEIYDHRWRWLAYWAQIDAIKRTGAQRVLEIGPGSNAVSTYLRHVIGLTVDTFDRNTLMNPTYLGDIRSIDEIVPDASYDVVVAYQILEHIPFDDFAAVVPKLARITRKYCVVSVPHCGFNLQIDGRIGPLNINISRRLTPPWGMSHKRFPSYHQWEIGGHDFPLKRVAAVFEQSFVIRRQYFCQDVSYHYFFECEKK